MQIQINLANTLCIQSGILQTGYLIWSLYGESAHQESIQVSEKVPAFQIRETGEKNFSGYIKLPTLQADNEFKFKTTLSFSNTNLKFQVPNFKLNEYPKTLVTQYCRSSKFWEIYDPELIEIARNLLPDSKEFVVLYLQKAFHFVQSNIKFRENLDTRLGAKLALKNGKGDCDEFSDLFITLCRINQIPARRVMGILITDINKFSLHAWTEVFIPPYQKWIPFDAALNEFASIRWNYIIRAHIGLTSEVPLVRLKSKVAKNFHAKFEDNDILQIDINQ